MRRRLIAGFLTLGVIAGGQIDLSACGDKFLLVGRGATSRKAYAALYPASILIFAGGPVSGPTTTISDSRFATALKQAGHRVQVVTTASAAADALSSVRYDIVLASFSDAVSLEGKVNAVPAPPRLVPLLYQPAPPELAAATRQFGVVLKGPDRVTRFLAQIDELMKSRRPAPSTAKG